MPKPNRQYALHLRRLTVVGNIITTTKRVIVILILILTTEVSQIAQVICMW